MWAESRVSVHADTSQPLSVAFRLASITGVAGRAGHSNGRESVWACGELSLSATIISQGPEAVCTTKATQAGLLPRSHRIDRLRLCGHTGAGADRRPACSSSVTSMC